MSNSMEQIPYWEADSHSSSQEIPILYETEDSLPCLQDPAIGLYPEPYESNPHALILFS